jgi:uncharacterized HAD superfamily protein
VYNYQCYYAKEERNFYDFWKEATEKVFSTPLGNFWLTNNLFYVQRDIRPDYLEVIDVISKSYDIYYITSRVKTAWNPTRYWFKRNNMPFKDNLYFAEGEKLPLILQHKIDVFVEDRIKHVLELKNHTDVVLVQQPWNELIWDEVTTINSVLELPELLGVSDEQEKEATYQ